MKEKKLKMYWKLFISTFSLSAFTFGGGYVIISLMKEKFVDDLHWIEEKELLDLTAIAQSAPGAVAVNASIILGYRMAGFIGAMVSILGTVLPPLIILSIVSLFYVAFRDNVVVNAVLKGMQAGVGAVICDVVMNLSYAVMKEKNIVTFLIMPTAFILNYFLGINVVYIIILSGAIGAANFYANRKRLDKAGEE